MKKLLTLFISVAVFSSCIMPTPVESPPPISANFENTLNVAQNYIKANEWMVETFNDAESVIQFSDKESGIVKGKYIVKKGYVSTSPYMTSTESLYAIITIRVKDNAYRIEVDPPSGMYTQKFGTTESGYTPALFSKDVDELILSFEQRMSDSSSKDW
jgi:hypothetical protein